MTTTPTLVPGLDGVGRAFTIRADQNPDLSLALRSSLEVGGAAVGGANPIPIQQASFALTNSVASTMGTAVSIIVPFSATRRWLMITNRTAGTETQDIGSSNVVVGSGIPLIPGGGFLFQGAGAAGPIYGITTVPSSAFSYVEG